MVLYTPMPGQRAKGQKLIPIPMSEKFRAALDKAIQREGFENRSAFIRKAVEEKLNQLGYPVPKEDTVAPSRQGKGGRKKVSSDSALGTALTKAAEALERRSKLSGGRGPSESGHQQGGTSAQG